MIIQQQISTKTTNQTTTASTLAMRLIHTRDTLLLVAIVLGITIIPLLITLTASAQESDQSAQKELETQSFLNLEFDIQCYDLSNISSTVVKVSYTNPNPYQVRVISDEVRLNGISAARQEELHYIIYREGDLSAGKDSSDSPSFLQPGIHQALSIISTNQDAVDSLIWNITILNQDDEHIPYEVNVNQNCDLEDPLDSEEADKSNLIADNAGEASELLETSQYGKEVPAPFKSENFSPKMRSFIAVGRPEGFLSNADQERIVLTIPDQVQNVALDFDPTNQTMNITNNASNSQTVQNQEPGAGLMLTRSVLPFAFFFGGLGNADD